MINQAETILLGSIQATTPGHLTLRVEKEYFQYTPTAHVMVSFPADTCADISLEHGTRVLIFARADASPDTATIDLQYLRLDEAILVIHGDTVTSALRNIPYGSLAAIETEIARDSRAKSQTSNTVPPKLAEAQTVSPTMPTSSVFTPAAKPWTTTTDENQHRRIWGIIGILAVEASILYLLHSRRRERVKR